jgi:hypothetical protein
MEFKLPYLLAMRQQDPKEFMALRRAGKLDQHVQEKAEEASRLLKELLARAPRDSHGEVSLAARREAEEHVRATLIDFPVPKRDQNPEPPDDLPTVRMRSSAASTSRSNRGT